MVDHHHNHPISCSPSQEQYESQRLRQERDAALDMVVLVEVAMEKAR